MEEQEEPEMRLIYPFVNVSSNGGRFDDDAYAAGWEMGKIDMRLEALPVFVHSFTETIREENAKQADLVAMHRGWDVETIESGVDGWVFATFGRLADE